MYCVLTQGRAYTSKALSRHQDNFCSNLSLTGIPGFAYFTLSPGQKLYETDTGDEFDRLTLLK